MRCQNRCHRYNQILPSRLDLREILGKTGERFRIEQPFHCDYGSNITLGEDFYANYHLVILDAAEVCFGAYVFIAPNCGFYIAGHPLDAARRNAGLEYARPIRVGNHVWIGAHVAVLPGVLAGGNLCRVIRALTAQEQGMLPL